MIVIRKFANIANIVNNVMIGAKILNDTNFMKNVICFAFIKITIY